jgi:hypothetical protein
MLILQAPGWTGAPRSESHAGSRHGFIPVAKTGHRNTVIKETAETNLAECIGVLIDERTGGISGLFAAGFPGTRPLQLLI